MQRSQRNWFHGCPITVSQLRWGERGNPSQRRVGGCAERVWELRGNLTVYDAWYVALAESLRTDLVTADQELRHAAGPRCLIRLPGEPA